MFSAIRDVLSSSLLFWESAGYISTGVVIFGCVGEYIADFTGIPRDDAEKHKISKLSLMILTVGIAGELLTAVRSSQISGRVISDLQTTVRDARKSASDAADAADRAKTVADVAKTSATNAGIAATGAETTVKALDVRMNDASLKLDKLDKRLAWRTVTPQQFASFKKALLPFAGSKVVVITYQNEDSEAPTLAGYFLHLFHDAGWEIALSQRNISIPLPTDVTCRFDPDTAAGKALGAVMKKWGAIVLPQKVPGLAGTVTVGTRPPP